MASFVFREKLTVIDMILGHDVGACEWKNNGEKCHVIFCHVKLKKEKLA